MTRIPDPDRSLMSTEDHQALAALPDLALFRLLANAPTVIGPWLALGGSLLASVEVPPRPPPTCPLRVGPARGDRRSERSDARGDRRRSPTALPTRCSGVPTPLQSGSQPRRCRRWR